MPFVKTGKELTWHYETRGRGEALLFIHGWAGDGDIWQQQIDFFCEKFQVITIDLPGHGGSSWEESDLHQLSLDIEFILDSAGVKKVNLIAVSLGGLVALQFAKMFPQRLSSLTLVDTAARFVSEDTEEGITAGQIKKLSELLEADFVKALLIFARSLFTSQERKALSFKKSWDILIRKMILPQKKALQEFLKILKETDLRAILPEIKIRTLILSGDRDHICGRPKAEELKAKLPNSLLKFIPDTGHLPFLTRPETFNLILQDFILDEKVIREGCHS